MVDYHRGDFENSDKHFIEYVMENVGKHVKELTFENFSFYQLDGRENAYRDPYCLQRCVCVGVFVRERESVCVYVCVGGWLCVCVCACVYINIYTEFNI